MEGSIFMPMLLGFVVNVALFAVTRYAFKRTFQRAMLLTWIAATITLISSFIVAGWQGMGIGIISLGMFICSVVLTIIHSVPLHK